MGKKNRISDEYLYFLTLTIQDWVDVFTKPVYKHIITDSLKFCQDNKGLELYAWCLMSNHLHLIAGAEEGSLLSDILRDFKKFTSKEIINKIKDEHVSRSEWMLYRFSYAAKYNKKIKEFKVWMDGNEAKELHSNEFIEQKVEYIHYNPVKAEIVSNPEEYLYSSAMNYAGIPGLLDIILLE